MYVPKEYPKTFACCIFKASIKPAVSLPSNCIEYGSVPDVVFPIPRLSKIITVLFDASLVRRAGSHASMSSEAPL